MTIVFLIRVRISFAKRKGLMAMELIWQPPIHP